MGANLSIFRYRTHTLTIMSPWPLALQWQKNQKRLRGWFRTKIKRRSSKGDESPTAPAGAIPAGLSLLPSSDSVILDDDPWGSAHSAFFTSLPPEIRHQIYLYAFGQRTIHLDLRYSAAPPRGTDAHDHAGIGRGAAQWIGSTSCNTPKKWRWWSSVCHRNPVEPPWFDACRVGGRGVCWLFNDYAVAMENVKTDDEREGLKERVRNGIDCAGEKCFLGVRGWLGSCRQA